jgi:hypothetical protein
MTWKNDYAERKKARRDDLSVMEVADLQTLAELGMFQFVSSAYADRYFKKHSRWPKADVVLDLQQSAMRLAYTAQSIGLTTVYEALNDDQWLVTTKCGNTEALKELARIDKVRQSAYNESRSEEKEMWSDTLPISWPTSQEVFRLVPSRKRSRITSRRPAKLPPSQSLT